MSNFTPSFSGLPPKALWMQQWKLQHDTQMVVDSQTRSPEGIDEEIFNSSEEVNEAPPQSLKRKTPPSQSLEFLAEMAEEAHKKQKIDDLEKFWGLLKLLEMATIPSFLRLPNYVMSTFKTRKPSVSKYKNYLLKMNCKNSFPFYAGITY